MSLLHQLREYELRMRLEGKKSVLEGGETQDDEMPFMYALQNVRWEVRLRADGTVRDVLPLSSGKTKGKDLGRPTPAPNLVRTVDIKPRLLMDNAEYVLGLAKKEGDKKVVQRHESFKALVATCAEATNEPNVQAVEKFLSSHDPQSFKEAYLPSDFTPDTNVMFTVDGVEPLKLPTVQKLWATQFATGDADGESAGITGECLITGEIGPMMAREPVKIKGILGGQTSGMNFISANAQAFESYGLQASQIAPVKFEVAEQYANGLNRLLADPNTSLKVGGVTYAFWTDVGAVPLVSEALREPPTLRRGKQKSRDKKVRSEEVRQVLWSVFTGQQSALKPGAAFYAVGLTPSGSRIAVRTHLTSTVQEAVDKLAAYFEAQILVKARDEDRETYDLRTLVSAMYRDINKEHTATDVDALVQFALTGRPLPRSFLVRLAGRNRTDDYHVTRPRTVLTKMVLLSHNWKELDMDKDTLEALNPEQSEPAYHLGRLLAVLDDVQTSAMRGVNTTLVDRFYGSMSTTPYAVVGRLIQGSQAHLQKLRKENEPAYRAKQNELESVMSRLRDIPAKPLSTAQQALFALGYYHQRAHIQAGIRERVAAKKEREARVASTEVQPTQTEGGQE